MRSRFDDIGPYARRMPDHLQTLVGQLTHLHGRATELSVRLLRDAELLAATQTEMATLVARLWERPVSLPPTQPAAQTQPHIIRLPEVCRVVGLSRSTVWKMASERRFPVPRRLGGRSVGWLSTEVDAWMASRE